MIGLARRTRVLTIRDGRGHPRPIPSPHFKLEIKPEEGLVLWYRLARVRRLAESRAITVAAILLALMAGGTGAAAVWTYREGQPLNAVAFTIASGVFVVGTFAWRRQMRRELARLEKARFDLRARCASCRYDLAGLPAEHDGCVVCPECGAAWLAANPTGPAL